MAEHVYLNDVAIGTPFEGVYSIDSVTVEQEEKHVVLSDASGSLNGSCPLDVEISQGIVAHIQAVPTWKNDAAFIRISSVVPLNEGQFNPLELFEGISDKTKDALTNCIHAYIDAVDDTHLKALLEKAFEPEVINQLAERPASLSRQGCYRGGALVQTIAVTMLALHSAAVYSKCSNGLYTRKPSKDLMIAAGLLHTRGLISFLTPYPAPQRAKGAILQGAAYEQKKAISLLIEKSGIKLDEYTEGLLLNAVSGCCENPDKSSRPVTNEGVCLCEAYKMFSQMDRRDRAFAEHEDYEGDTKDYFYDTELGYFLKEPVTVEKLERKD